MRNKRNRSGFTMAELLVVVAIIAVLGGVAFVAVQNHYRSMAQLERDAIAKELFVAAQNHLTMAESQGYLAESVDFGTPTTATITHDDGTTSDAKDVYYVGVSGSAAFSGNTVLNLMLPFGSIDETVRAGGSYIIRYQANPAIVLDVFYCPVSGDRFTHDISNEYDDVLPYGSDTADRKNYKGVVLGWYGGEGALPSGRILYAPIIEVENAERLTVKVTDTNKNLADDEGNPIATSLKLIITGEESDAQAAITLNPIDIQDRISYFDGKYTITLDDITGPGLHFADLNDLKGATIEFKTEEGSIPTKFQPGENITVEAVAYSNAALMNIAYSSQGTTNSLFADPGETATTAMIANFRHLENLDADISGLDSTLGYNGAEQVEDLGDDPLAESDDDATTLPGDEAEADLSWPGFVTAIKEAKGSDEAVKVYGLSDETGTADNTYRPINPNYALAYEGNDHIISGVKVSAETAAGLFGAPTAALTVSNLKLIDFDITGSGDAGALAGTLGANATVENVVAYNSDILPNADDENDEDDAEGTPPRIVSENGNAGGLVGSITDGSIKGSAAALIVQGSANAGGLVGSASGATVTGSYSGGHTAGGKYSTTDYNVTATAGSAGGLIGGASGATTVTNSYSTCSAKGTAASGGLIGKTEGVGVTALNSYAAGLVARSTVTVGEGDSATTQSMAGAFLGTGALKDGSAGYYVSGINGTLPSGSGLATVFDMTQVTVNIATKPYDVTLVGEKYPFLTVGQLSESEAEDEHYGDWQAPVKLNTGLELVNVEKLTAKISLPVDDLDDDQNTGQNITMLVQGKTSEKAAYLVFALDEAEGGYALSLQEESAISALDDSGNETTLTGDALQSWLANSGAKPTVKDGVLTIEIDLDSITTEGGHFAQLFSTLIPGEDIVVVADGNVVPQTAMKAVADNDSKWMVAEDEETRTLAAQTNSLFEALATDAGASTASIGNIRHLENLDGAISGLANDAIASAIQTKNLSLNPADGDQPAVDLSWQGFVAAIKAANGNSDPVKVYGLLSTDVSREDTFRPVSPAYALEYNGQGNSITGIKVDYDGDAGLFGTMTAGSAVSNLELIDFEITGTDSAGVLAGALNGTTAKPITVTNVLARNTGAADTATVTATGDAGGLVGNMTNSSVERSAAALVVESTGGNAGGLVGASLGGSVSGSYAGGHTDGGEYKTYNVTGSTNAGGLIGDAGSTTITSSYSTCSAKGDVAGGLVGTAGGTIANSYATGLVNGTTAGAFAGSLTGSASACSYFEIINGDLPAVGSGTGSISAFDATAATYDSFVGAPADWRAAEPYDGTLATYYQDKYCLGTAAQLGSIGSDDFVSTHYGDWPAPEVFVVNTAS